MRTECLCAHQMVLAYQMDPTHLSPPWASVPLAPAQLTDGSSAQAETDTMLFFTQYFLTSH